MILLYQVFSITDPVAGTVAKNGITINGTCETGLAINISGAGVAAASSTSCGAGVFTTLINFSSGDGNKVVQISQTDTAGNVATASRTFVRDTIAPVIAITQPAAGTAGETGLTILGTCEGTYNVVASGSGVASSISVACSGGQYSLNVVFTGGTGAKTVQVSQTDVAGNTGIVSRDYARTSAPDGALLYAQNCAACHGQLSASNKGRSPYQIVSAMNSLAEMSALRTLNDAQISAISSALGYIPGAIATCRGTRPADVTALFRLNKGEYLNTVGDLFSSPATVTDNFPPDNDGQLFPNNANELKTVSGDLAYQYLLTAEAVVTKIWSTNKTLIMTCNPSSTAPATCAGNIIDAWGLRVLRRLFKRQSARNY